jgi:hypothetical protein
MKFAIGADRPAYATNTALLPAIFAASAFIFVSSIFSNNNTKKDGLHVAVLFPSVNHQVKCPAPAESLSIIYRQKMF